MDSVLTTGPKVHGLNPGQRRRIFKGDKIRSTPSVGGEVKPSVRCRTISRHVKRAFRRINKDNPIRQIHHSLRPVPPTRLLDDSAGRVARELKDKSGVFSCRYNYTTVLLAHMSPGR
jgi:hypothetical protein